MTASALSENTGISASHTSKVIRAIEKKELIVRSLGNNDKRKMLYFTLSQKGLQCLTRLKENDLEIPDIFLQIFETL